ncbi:hypothetical protein [Halorubrum sp. DTA46]|uniref:hypothetical protein n=1 Tax=Halorubrum sp. DTA46 TaxID=3402162 RepID=UPI003AAD7BD8
MVDPAERRAAFELDLSRENAPLEPKRTGERDRPTLRLPEGAAAADAEKRATERATDMIVSTSTPPTPTAKASSARNPTRPAPPPFFAAVDRRVPDHASRDHTDWSRSLSLLRGEGY